MTKNQKLFRSNLILQIMLMMGATLACFAVIIYFTGSQRFTQILTSLYEKNAASVAYEAVSHIDTDTVDEALATLGNTAEYDWSQGELDILCNNMEMNYIYLIRPDTSDYGHITFIYNSVNRAISNPPYPCGYVLETTNEEYRECYRALYEGTSEYEVVLRDTNLKKGALPHITVLVAAKDSSGKVVGLMAAERPMDGLQRGRDAYRRFIIRIAIALFVILNLIYAYLVSRNLVTPILDITEETKRFARENTQAPEPLAARVNQQTELHELANAVDTMEAQTVEYFRELTQAAAREQRIGTELDIAARIQYGSLPHDFPAFPDRKEFDIYATMDPAQEVGGDFYDFFLLDDDHLAIVMADVSGKGISASLFMMAAKTMISYRAAFGGGTPGEILHDANELLLRHNVDMFVTVWLGILELSTGHLIVANGGHEDHAVCLPGEQYQLVHEKHSFVLGGMSGVRYRNYEYTLEPGSSLFVYTDGVPEATDKDNELFGLDRMMTALNQDPSAPPVEVLKNVRTHIDSFVGDAPQFDDITMLGLRYNGPVNAPSGDENPVRN